MFIQTQATPNPATMKFLPGRDVMGDGGVMDFASDTNAAKSPLAERLFALEGISAVFFGNDFIAVTKDDSDWAHIKPAILGAIMEHFVSGDPLLRGLEEPEEKGATAADSEVVLLIKELIDTRVRPAVAQDGGDIAFQGFDEPSGTVFLQMRGACADCPSSTMTLKHGIENLLRHYIPEVNAVEEAF